MKKLVNVFILVILLILLTSCKLVVETQDNPIVQEDIPPKIIGFRVLREMSMHQSKDTPDYYYEDDREVSPFITAIKKEDYIDAEGANVHHVEVDYYINPTDDKCVKLEMIYEHTNKEIEYGDNTWMCGGSSISQWVNFKSNEFNNTVKYTVNIKLMKKVISYVVVTFDENYNKISEQSIHLTNENQEILLGKDAEYFKIIKTSEKVLPFQDGKTEITIERNFYSIDNLKSIQHSENIYTYDENNKRTNYNFSIKLKE